MNTLTVEEQHDEHGDIVWTFAAATHDRRTLDTLADALAVRLRVVTDADRHDAETG